MANPRAPAVLERFHPTVRQWFTDAFAAPTPPQVRGWPAIARGDSALILAPTGSGKTLAAFLWCINRLLFEPPPADRERCRVLYVSPLKALAVDIERNLRSPLAGISRIADAAGTPYLPLSVAVRSGDTPAAARARFQRHPADILITTPESLYLLLTSNAREVLRSIDTVIVDEIHALVATKRGAHLALSIERLAALATNPLQRIGLSATARPRDEIAHYLGGATPAGTPAPLRDETAVDEQIHAEFQSLGSPITYRPVTIVDATAPKRLELCVEVPVEDMARLGQPSHGRRSLHGPPQRRTLPIESHTSRPKSDPVPVGSVFEADRAGANRDYSDTILDIPSGPASQGPVRASIWTAIHPRLLELIRQHRSTLLFVNSRRVAERLAGALNDLAGETLVRSHHGSIAREQRIEIEDRLKAGLLQGLVATSSLELGIDMGAVDLVVQIEAPPSVASGLQRIGRAGHQVDASSRGIIFPKYRADLVACAAITRAMEDGQVEATRYPRNPLDVLAQQIVATVAMEDQSIDDLFSLVRRAAPFASLSRRIFEGVLDMLSGRYPSDDFAELRPRVTWDRLTNRLSAREGARRVAVINGGTIPDRGLFGVFLAGAKPGSARVGELDEEMVFESRVGETFLLGATTWRIEEITHDRVLVTPAPGEPGKMPFWKGEAPGRPLELGQRIGRLVRELREMPAAAAESRLTGQHSLDRQAAQNLLQYLGDQAAAAGFVPDERTILVERYRDELGDWRVCVLSPLGGRVHAPWAMAVVAKVRDETGLDVETMWTDDGFVVRFPETDDPPDTRLIVLPAGEVEALVLRQIGSSALFAGKFREAAGRALLLPRRRAGGRTPLWQTRKKAADLLAVAARFGSFPIVLETYRECLRDLFDVPALVATLQRIGDGAIRVNTIDSTTPSPFAASLLFGYVANYIYDGDAPLAERRAQALAIDQAQLKELLGDIELRELLDADAIDAVERQLQHLDERYRVRTADALHDLLLRIGDLTADEILRRSDPAFDALAALAVLVRTRRLVLAPIAGAERYLAVEDAGRYRDALGTPLPSGLPQSLLEPVRDPRGDLASRFARTHAPFTTNDFAERFGLGRGVADATLRRLFAAGRLLEGEFRPDGTHREWCDPDVLRHIRRRSLAKLRQQAEPVDPPVLARLVATWQGIGRRRGGLDALLDVVESLQGAPLAVSVLEREILPARIEGYDPAHLDALAAAGEVRWAGIEPLGDRDGRIALYLTDHLPRLWRPRIDAAPPIAEQPESRSRKSNRLQASGFGLQREALILASLDSHGASFFAALHEAAGGGYPGDSVQALWALVWAGLITNDSFHALRAYASSRVRRRRDKHHARTFRSRRAAPPAAEGRWSLVLGRGHALSPTEWSAATAQQLLARYGVVTREVAGAEGLAGGFSSVYDVLRAMDEAGRIRRGYFVAGVAGTQFALPSALEQLRALRDAPDVPQVVHLAATDPANPYGAMLKWPALGDTPAETPRLARAVGASVLLVDGEMAGYLGKGGRTLTVFLPEDEPRRSRTGRAIAARLADVASGGDARAGGLLVAEVNGLPAREHPIAPFLTEAGFVSSGMGYYVRREGNRGTREQGNKGTG